MLYIFNLHTIFNIDLFALPYPIMYIDLKPTQHARYGPVFGSISMLDLVLELDGSSLTISIYDVQSPTKG